MRIQSNNLVRRSDGSIAYRMEFTCRNKECSNHGTIVKTEYDPATVIDEASE